MNRFIAFTNRHEIQRLLLSLAPDTTPLWGKMKPQQMIEHLVEEMKWTNGKKIATCDRLIEDAEKSKQVMIYTDAEIPKNVFIEHLPAQYAFADIPEAVRYLMIELNNFDAYFEQPGASTVHGYMGPLTYHEWIIYHGKHFTHHLKQFGLWH